MPAPKSGVPKGPRVGTCVSCRLAVYQDCAVEVLGELMHPACKEAQDRQIAGWNRAVRENNESLK